MNALTPASVAWTQRAADVVADRVGDVAQRALDPLGPVAAAGRATNASAQRGPPPTMKMLRIRIVTVAKIELTTPTPMSCSTPAASPILLGRSSATLWSSLVKSYLSLRSLSVSFSLTKSVTSWAYCGTLSARSSIWPTSDGISSAPRPIGIMTRAR